MLIRTSETLDGHQRINNNRFVRRIATLRDAGRTLIISSAVILTPSLSFDAGAQNSATPKCELCKSGNKPTLKKSFEESSVVIVGRILERNQNPLKPGFIEYKATPLSTFKDETSLNMDPVVFYRKESQDGSACAESFAPGYEYLVFTSGNPAFLLLPECSRSDILEKVQADVENLSNLKSLGGDTSTLDSARPGAKQPKATPKLDDQLKDKRLLSADEMKTKSRL